MTKADLDIATARAWCEGSSDEARFRMTEVVFIERQLDELYDVLRRGEGTVLQRARVKRLEALCSALQGFPEALSK